MVGRDHRKKGNVLVKPKFIYSILFVLCALTISCGSGSDDDAGEPGALCSLTLGQGCSGDLFCEFTDDSCGVNGAVGICQDEPDACAELFSATCGCDGKTYSNPCEAASFGISVQHAGACS